MHVRTLKLLKGAFLFDVSYDDNGDDANPLFLIHTHTRPRVTFCTESVLLLRYVYVDYFEEYESK
jgi:hypothetical protein